MRLIVANLDCENDFAADAGIPPQPLPGPVLQRISAAGTLMSALGRPGDALWTPLAVDPARLALDSSIRLHSGALPERPRPDALLAWGETRAVAALREHAPHAQDGQEPHETPTHDWIARLWQVHPDPEVARHCNDRRACFALARTLGHQLPGAALLDSVEALETHLAAGGAAAGHEQAWVLEAPFSASGRLRLRRRGATLDQPSRTRAGRLFARFGTLCFQPWVERVLDFGCLGLVEGPDRWMPLPPHRLDSDAAGVFRGISIAPEPSPVTAWLDENEHRMVTETAAAVARALADAGYRGPFGIDGFAYRLPGQPPGQERRLLPMCEINARLSFGFVAHALARRLGAARLRLCLGAGPVPSSAQVVPLLLPDASPSTRPGAGDDTSAWAEI